MDMYSGYGSHGGMQMPHYSKSQVLEGLQMYLINNGIQVNNIIKIEDFPYTGLKHPCSRLGDIALLNVMQFDIPEMGFSVPFYICPTCGNLYIPKDFM